MPSGLSPRELLEKLSEILIPSADAGVSFSPPPLVIGTVAHLLISADLFLKNPGLEVDFSLEKLMFKVAPFLEVKEKLGKLRPDLARLTSLEYWEIKSVDTIISRPAAMIEQLEAYENYLVPGKGLLGLPGKMDVNTNKGVTLTLDFDLRAPGLIAYQISFDVSRLIFELGRKVVDEFIQELRDKVKKLADDRELEYVLYAIAIVLIIAAGTVEIPAAALTKLAVSAVDLLAAQPLLLGL